MSLRMRLTLTYTVLMAIALATLGVVLSAATFESMQTEIDRRLQVRADQVLLTLFPRSQALTMDELRAVDLRPLSTLDAPGIYVQIIAPDGEVLASSSNLEGLDLPVEPAQLVAAAAGTRHLSEQTYLRNQPLRVLTVPLRGSNGGTGRSPGILVVGQSRQQLYDLMDELRNVLLVLSTVALGLSVTVGWVVTRQGLRPLARFSDEAAAIAEGRNFRLRVTSPVPNDEVGQLSSTMNRLLATVDQTLTRHREFMADASHELRNPLLALRTNLELLDRVTDPANRAECIREAHAQVERLSRLVSDLLMLAQVESGLVITRNSIQMFGLVNQVVAEFRRRAPDRSILVTAENDCPVVGDDTRLRQVLLNLLDNADKYSPPGSPIAVRLAKSSDSVLLSVTDFGEGIAPQYISRIFDRFYRAPRPGRIPGEGTGLGLSIVKHLVEAHAGTVSVQSVLDAGTTFTVTLPLARSEDSVGDGPEAGDVQESDRPSTRARRRRSGKTNEQTKSAA